jgi:hypothetical protein
MAVIVMKIIVVVMVTAVPIEKTAGQGRHEDHKTDDQQQLPHEISSNAGLFPTMTPASATDARAGTTCIETSRYAVNARSGNAEFIGGVQRAWQNAGKPPK